MDKSVGIRVEIDPGCKVPQVIIKADQESVLTQNIIKAIERCVAGEYPQITVYNGDAVLLLDQWQITRFYTENRKLIVSTDNGNYETRMNLKELEDILDDSSFVRISRFEIVNLKKVSSFDLSISGTIKVNFDDGSETWVARRYVRTIQEKLRLKRGGESR